MKQAAMLETITVIAVLHGHEDLLNGFIEEFRIYGLSTRGKDTLQAAGFDTVAQYPLPWLWDFLFLLEIFRLSEQKKAL
jgi:hypothetical protein